MVELTKITIPELEEIEKECRLGAFSVYDMECICPELTKLMPNEVYLEIGVDKGKSLSFARHVTNPEVIVCGVDIKEDPKVENTVFFHGKSNEVAQWNWFNKFGLLKISLLFIDGDHTYQGCKTDIESWFPHMKQHGVMFFHDHDESSPGVLQAVSEFVNNYKGSLDYRMFKKTDKNTSMAGIWL